MRNTIERAVWTGVQSGIAVLVVVDTNLGEALAVAGLAAAISALKTISQDRLAVLNPPE